MGNRSYLPEFKQEAVKLVTEQGYTLTAARLHSSLRDMGITIGINRVKKLMRVGGIKSCIKRKFKATTDSKHKLNVAPNILAETNVIRVNQAWTQDITYIHTNSGFLYLAVVMDLYSRQIIGWAMGSRMTRYLVISALLMAIFKRKAPSNLICHSDRGSQYCSYDYQQVLRQYKITSSMSAKGRCYDNAHMESFFHSLKTEWVYQHKYLTREAATSSIFNYIECFYNKDRKHSSLGYCSPIQFEQYLVEGKAA